MFPNLHLRRCLWAVGLLTALCGQLFGQELRISVVVPSPPPVTWDAFLEFDADIRLVVTNTTRRVREVKLLPTLTSDRGLSVSFLPSFQPLSPIIIGPRETVTLDYRDLRAIYGKPGQADVQLSGISFERMFESETIPEGSYTLCIEASDFATGRPLSNNFGCGVFYVQQFEPPLIIYPGAGTQVQGTQPQFVNFLWSTTGIPGRTRYRFALYDLDELGLRNPNDAFLLQQTRPYFETDDLVGNTLAYDLAFPPLEYGRRYAVQVTAYDPENGQIFAQNGRSQIHQFTYEAPPNLVPDLDVAAADPVTPPDGPNDFDNGGGGQQLSMEACPDLPPPLADQFNGSLSAGQTVTVGNHEMILNTGGTQPLAGTGRIQVESLNTYINVSFTGLRVNQNMQAYGEGVVVTATAGGNPNLDALSEAAALQLADLVDNNGTWLDPEGVPGAGINLPAGVAGAGMDLILTGMTFTPQGATLDLFAKVELPEAQGDRRLLLVGQGACLNEEDLGANADLLLAQAQEFSLAAGVTMTFAAGEEGTRLRWDGNGIDRLDVVMDLAYGAAAMPENEPFAARVTAQVEDYQDWIGTVELDPQNQGHTPREHVSFSYSKIEFDYDHSSTQNPGGLTLPPGHPHAGNPQLFQGLYLADFDVIFPSGFDVKVGAENLLLDAQGVWVDLDLDGNILSIDDGEVGGWALGIDGLRLDIRGSTFHAAGFDGRIRLPIGETAVAFSAPLGGDDDFEVSLSDGTPVEMDMLIAQLNLAGNSSVGFQKVGDSFRPTATLNGALSIGWTKGENEDNNAVGSFSLPSVEFQDFTITGGPGVPQLDGTFSLDVENMGQGALANFPLQFTDQPSFTFAGDEVTFGLPLGLKLTEIANGFDAGTTFGFVGKWDGGQKKFRYNRTELQQLSINADVGIMTLEGNLNLYNNDPTFGDGFDGFVDMQMSYLNVGVEMQLIVGRKTDYRYFMIDVLARFPGIPLGPSGLGLFGLGGGFYYNMDRVFDPEAFFDINDTPEGDEPVYGSSRGEGGWSGVSYVPESGKLGFNAKVVLGVLPTTASFNADLEFGMELSTQFGLTEMWMSGKGYVMQDMADREGDALISGEVTLNIWPQEPRIALVAKLQANVFNLMTGDVTLDLLFSPDQWHVYLGRWTPTDNPATYDYQQDNGRNALTAGIDFGFVNVNTGTYSYYMMGNDLEPSLPPKPHEITSIFDEKPGAGSLPGGGLGTTLTTGFAFGMVNDFNLSFKALIFRLDARYFLGFDVILANLANQQCSQENFGINKWYAAGSAYAYLDIHGSVEGKLFGKVRSFEFARIEAAASMQFKGPKPTWLKGQAALSGRALGGLIKFNTKVRFEFGKEIECSDGGSNIFDDIPIVEDFDPKTGAQDQSVFADPTVTFNFPRGVFPIEEENDEGESVTTYYSYEIMPTNGFRVNVKAPGGSWQPYAAEITGPNYDEAGYSCRYDLRGQFSNNAEVEMIIRARGRRNGSNSYNNVAEYFEVKEYKTKFTVGKAPDYILTNSFDQMRPFPFQRHFFRNSPGGGYWNIWTDRVSDDIFRSSPSPDDDLDPNGSYRYRVRYRDLVAGTHRDVVPTQLDHEAGGGINFPIPGGWLQPEKIYEIDLVRIYNPPAGSEIADNTTIAMTNMSTASGGVGGGGTLGTLTLQASQQINIKGSKINQNVGGGDTELGLSGGGNGGTNFVQASLNTGSQIFGVPDDSGPDPPAPDGPPATFADPNGGGGPGLVGPGNLLAPGGDLGGVKYEARKVKVRGRTSNAVVTSILQQPFYFRTSAYGTKQEKIGTVNVESGLGEPKTLEYHVDPDPGSEHADGQYIDAPIFFLSAGEPFDRFETHSWKYTYVVSHKGNASKGNSVWYYPHFSFGGDEYNWLFQTFPGDGAKGMRRRPFYYNDSRRWCTTVFDDPDAENIYPPGENINPGQTIYNPPLHTESAQGEQAWYTFYPYIQAGDNWGDELNDRRYGNQLYISKRSSRKFPVTTFPTGGNYEHPTVEFFRFNHAVHVPGWSTDLDFKVQNTARSLSWSEIHGAKTMGQQQGGIQGGINQWQIPDPGDGYIPVVDLSEVIAAKDYATYRRLIYEGTTYLAEFSETADNPQMDHLFNQNTDPDCDNPPGPIPGHPDFSDQEANYNYWYQYDKPIRAWLKDDLEYRPRTDDSDVRFSIEGRSLLVTIPEVNN